MANSRRRNRRFRSRPSPSSPSRTPPPRHPGCPGATGESAPESALDPQYERAAETTGGAEERDQEPAPFLATTTTTTTPPPHRDAIPDGSADEPPAYGSLSPPPPPYRARDWDFSDAAAHDEEAQTAAQPDAGHAASAWARSRGLGVFAVDPAVAPGRAGPDAGRRTASTTGPPSPTGGAPLAFGVWTLDMEPVDQEVVRLGQWHRATIAPGGWEEVAPDAAGWELSEAAAAAVAPERRSWDTMRKGTNAMY